MGCWPSPGIAGYLTPFSLGCLLETHDSSFQIKSGLSIPWIRQSGNRERVFPSFSVCSSSLNVLFVCCNVRVRWRRQLPLVQHILVLPFFLVTQLLFPSGPGDLSSVIFPCLLRKTVLPVWYKFVLFHFLLLTALSQ